MTAAAATTAQPLAKAPTAEPAFELVYFPFKGRAEVLRLLAHFGGLSFGERVVTDWPASKHETPFGQLPVLIFKDVDGKEVRLAQSGAIKRFLAAKAGALPTDDPVASALIDSLGEAFRDMIDHIAQWKYRTPAGEQQDALRDKITGTIAPEFVTAVSRYLLTEGSGVSSGSEPAAAAGYFHLGAKHQQKHQQRGRDLTLAELDLYATIGAINELLPGTFTRERYPGLFRVVDNVRAHPKLQAYFAISATSDAKP